MREYITQLEATILDLGAEVCSMKSEMRDICRDNKKLQATLSTLKELLDEKGVVSEEDFEIALVDKSLRTSVFDEFGEETSLEKAKKPLSKIQH